jgi:thymidylate synthase
MFIAENLNQALLITGRALLEKGVWRETRGYRCLELPHPLLLCITNPTDRYCTIPERKWNKYLGWVESLWLAMGINDMKMPSHYVKNLLSFSDDGKYMRAGYGPRLRGYNGSTKDYKYSTSPAGRCGVDQLKFVIDTLQNEKTSRQACITIHDPIKDDYEWNGTEYVLKKTKDIPCTRTLQFMVVEGKLDCTVTMRSNDCIWGMSAVNVFNFTLMQEYIAGILGLEIGNYYHFVTNFHVYEDKVDQLKEIVENNKVEDYKSKHNFQYLLPNSLIYFDVFISELARFERRFREHSIRIDIDEYLKWETPIGEFGYLWKDWALVFYKHVFPEVEIKFNNPYLNDLFSK